MLFLLSRFLFLSIRSKMKTVPESFLKKKGGVRGGRKKQFYKNVFSSLPALSPLFYPYSFYAGDEAFEVEGFGGGEGDIMVGALVEFFHDGSVFIGFDGGIGGDFLKQFGSHQSGA